MSASKINQKLAKRLRQLRKKHKLTQEQTAELAGMDIRHYQKLESRSPNSPTLDTLAKLAKAFKITLSELLDFS